VSQGRGQRRQGEWKMEERKRKQRRLETKETRTNLRLYSLRYSFPEAVIEADLDKKAIQSKGEFNFADL
jgi:hypothetical protein